MNVLLAAALVAGAVAPPAAPPESYRYVAKFSSAADANFLFIDAYQGSINLNLDLDVLLLNNQAAADAGVGAKCAASDLKYHIHAGWTPDNGQTWGYGTQCGGSGVGTFDTGGHYDPADKCGSASDSDCPNGKGDNAQPAYDCSSMNKGGCEVGDLGGKFGKATEKTDAFWWDPDMDVNKNRNFSDMSIVFHCGSKTNASTKYVCSDTQYSDSTTCESNNETWDFADLDRAFCAKFTRDATFQLPAGTAPRVAKNVVAKFSSASDKNFLFIDQTKGEYTLNLDYAALSAMQSWKDAGVGAKCAEADLKYHIHSWPAGATGTKLTSACGKSETGGHFDPGFACGPATGSDCDFEKVCRDSAGATDVTCSQNENMSSCEDADAANGSKCMWGLYKYDASVNAEIGDLSSKNGKAKGSMNMAIPDGDLGMTANNGMGYDFAGMSVVFHCGSKTGANENGGDLDRAFCAELKVDAGFSLPTSTSPVSGQESQDGNPGQSSSAAGVVIGAAAALVALAL